MTAPSNSEKSGGGGWEGLPLSAEHAAMLEASAISPGVAERRGYRTVTTKADLERAGFSRAQCRVPTLLIPLFDVTGEVVLNQHRPDRPRLRSGKPLKYETPAGAHMVIDVPPALERAVLGDPAIPLIVTEGVKKADSAVSAGLACIGLLGVWNWRGRNEKGGLTALADWESIALNGRHVYVCFDSDVTVKREVRLALRRLCVFLEKRKAKVKIIYLPSTSEGDKQGLDDFLAAGGSAEALLALAENHLRDDPANDGDDRPEIVITTDEYTVTDAAVTALIGEPGLYHRGGKLVRVRVDRRASAAPVIECMPLPTIRELLTKNARLVQLKLRKIDGIECLVKEPAHPPNFLVREVDARGEWHGIRYLVGVTEHPTLRPDGSVLETPGYDEATGLLYVPSADFPRMIALPTRDDAIRAANMLLEVVADFPFVADEHRSAWLALLLTVLVREAFPGPVPLGAIDANTPGTGKTLLVDVLMQIATGRPATKTAMPEGEEELRKRITAHALAGDRAVLFDNIAQPLGGSALDAVLTATSWSDRILGRSEIARDLPLFTLWFATGNNLELRGDLVRRVLYIRLEAQQERPEERGEFRQPRLLEWVDGIRPRLVVAALSMVRAFIVAGRPDQELRNWGSFEGWSDLIRATIVWVGLPDPAMTRKHLIVAGDVRRDAHLELITGWAEVDSQGTGLTTAEVLRRLEDYSNKSRFEALRSAISQLTRLPLDKMPSAAQLGSHLRAVRGRIIGGRRLEEVGKRHGAAIWRVEIVDSREAGEHGEGREDVSKPSRETSTSERYGRTSDDDPGSDGAEGTSPCSPSSPEAADEEWF